MEILNDSSFRDSNRGAREAAIAAWDARVAQGKVSFHEMWEWILTTDMGSANCDPQSMGMNWICANPKQFAELVGDVWSFVVGTIERASHKVSEYDAAYSLGFEFLQRFINQTDLLEMIDQKERPGIVATIFSRWGAINNNWVNVAVRCGLKRRFIAELIIERLKKADMTYSGNFVSHFLRYGNDRGETHNCGVWSALRSLGVSQEFINSEFDLNSTERDTAKAIDWLVIKLADKRIQPSDPILRGLNLHNWWILTNDELQITLEICADKDCAETIKVAPQIRQRLGDEKTMLIVSQALSRTTSLASVPLSELSKFPLERRIEIAHRLVKPAHFVHDETTVKFLLGILVELKAMGDGPDFLNDHVRRILGDESISILYREWRRMQLDRPWIEQRLHDALENADYHVGRIKGERFTNKKGETKHQHFVMIGNMKCIFDDSSHRSYFPTDGDLVMFNTNRCQYLTPTVVIVHMTPVLKDVR